MIARWWRSERAPYEEWHLIALKPSGYWVPLAVVESKQRRDKLGWCMTACSCSGGEGSTWMGSSVRASYATRAEALRGAEAMVGLSEPVRHSARPAIWRRGWPYPPPVRRGRQRSRASRAGDVVEFRASFAQLLVDVSVAAKQVGGEEARRIAAEVFVVLARGDLGAAGAVVSGWGPRAVAVAASLRRYEAARASICEGTRAARRGTQATVEEGEGDT